MIREQNQPKMPVLFTVGHPLNEITPAICRTGGISPCYCRSFGVFNKSFCQYISLCAVCFVCSYFLLTL